MRGIHRWPVNSPHKWPVTQIASNAENVSIWWRHHVWCSKDAGCRVTHLVHQYSLFDLLVLYSITTWTDHRKIPRCLEAARFMSDVTSDVFTCSCCFNPGMVCMWTSYGRFSGFIENVYEHKTDRCRTTYCSCVETLCHQQHFYWADKGLSFVW